MAPRPDHNKIASGMSSVFLKLHRHWRLPGKTKDIKDMKMRRKKKDSGDMFIRMMEEGKRKIKHAIKRRRQMKCKRRKSDDSEIKHKYLKTFTEMYNGRRHRYKF
eukprot:1135982_1